MKEKSVQTTEIPINSDRLFKFLGIAEYKLRLYEETIGTQADQINYLKKELEKCKCVGDEK